MSKTWRPATQLVHGGTLRSQYGEMSEAIYLTQGFVYENSEAAEARFKGETEGFIYARYGSPTNAMFEKRMCLLEGAEEARATASGMAAVAAAMLCQVKAGDHIVAARALFGSCRWVVETLAPKYGIECTLVDGRSTGKLGKGDPAEHQGHLPGKPDQSDTRSRRYRGRCEARQSGRRQV